MTEAAEEQGPQPDTDGVAAAERPTPAPAVLKAFVARDVRTTLLSPAYLALGVGTVAAILGVALTGGSFEAGYTAVMLDLLLPLQLIIPVVGFAIGYNAVLGDRRRGELALLRTYPVAGWHVVTGTFAARGVGVLLVVVLPLAIVGMAIAITDPPRLPMYATHTGGESAIYFARFVILTLAFTLVMLAVAIAVSAIVSSRRGGLVASALAVILLVIGLDLAVIFGLDVGLVGDGELLRTAAISPLSAYRGLVFETAIQVAPGTGPQTAAVWPSLVSLLSWTISSLGIAAYAVNR